MKSWESTLSLLNITFSLGKDRTSQIRYFKDIHSTISRCIIQMCLPSSKSEYGSFIATDQDWVFLVFNLACRIIGEPDWVTNVINSCTIVFHPTNSCSHQNRSYRYVNNRSSIICHLYSIFALNPTSWCLPLRPAKQLPRLSIQVYHRSDIVDLLAGEHFTTIGCELNEIGKVPFFSIIDPLEHLEPNVLFSFWVIS